MHKNSQLSSREKPPVIRLEVASCLKPVAYMEIYQPYTIKLLITQSCLDWRIKCCRYATAAQPLQKYLRSGQEDLTFHKSICQAQK